MPQESYVLDCNPVKHVPDYGGEFCNLEWLLDEAVDTQGVKDRRFFRRSVSAGDENLHHGGLFTNVAQGGDTIHFRHDHVQNDELDTVIEALYRFEPVVRAHHGIAESGQAGFQGLQHFGLIIDDQDLFASCCGPDRPRRRFTTYFGRGREFQDELRAFIHFAADVDRAAGLLDDTVDHTQTQARAFGL